MKTPTTIPNFTIDAVQGPGKVPHDLMVMRFGEYLRARNFLFRPHRHSFYHLVYFSRGGGRHSIDFVHYPVRAGQIYFMTPGQVHHWEFEGDVDGYIVNFNPRHFQLLLSGTQYLEQFPFFGSQPMGQVNDLAEAVQGEVTGLLEKMLTEMAGLPAFAGDMVMTLLLQLFITVSRTMVREENDPVAKPGALVLRHFRQLIEANCRTKRLPKDYAALLYVSPNYLNSLCRDVLGVSSGEVIRERVLLEAKRLLVNAGLSISEIAYQLSFQDNSYFTKFFKKYAGVTPEEFRREFHVTAGMS